MLTPHFSLTRFQPLGARQEVADAWDHTVEDFTRLFS
jgi:hypothetical protein